MSTYARISGLPVVIEGCTLRRLERPTSSGWDRVSTEIALHGAGHTGLGEDVWIVPEDHDALLATGPPDLAGGWTLDALSTRLAEPDLFPGASDPHAHGFRRWAFEAAALDLGLRQAGLSLGDALGRVPRPVRFVLSLRLGEPSRVEPLLERAAAYPGMRFKLDPVADWDDDLLAAIAAGAPGAVAVLDFKAHYHGTPVDTAPDPGLYARCIAAFPDAWIEDPDLGPEVAPVLAPHLDRVTWDAPLHSLADLTALAHEPRMVNIKPCRFGSVRALMEVYDHCEARGIGMYGGGFFELGPGRGQIEYLASLFHPDGPNDVAPRGFHWPDPPAGLPGSPLEPAHHAAGFRWDDADPPVDGT